MFFSNFTYNDGLSVQEPQQEQMPEMTKEEFFAPDIPEETPKEDVAAIPQEAPVENTAPFFPQDIAVLQTNPPNGLTQFLQAHIGRRCIAEFSAGGMKAEKSGVLQKAADEFIVLELEDGKLVMCDLSALLFITF